MSYNQKKRVGIILVGVLLIFYCLSDHLLLVKAEQKNVITYYTGNTLEARVYELPIDSTPEEVTEIITGSLNIAVKNGYTRVCLPEGIYKMNQMLKVPSSITLEGIVRGEEPITTLQMVPKLEPKERTLLTAESGTKEAPTRIKNLILDGEWDASKNKIDENQRGIVLHPLSKIPEAGAGDNFYVGLKRKQYVAIEDTVIRNMGGSGIYLDFVKDVTISGTNVEAGQESNQIDKVGYAGIIGYSAEDVTIKHTKISNIGLPLDQKKQAYGIAFSWFKSTDDKTQLANNDRSRFGDTPEEVERWQQTPYITGYYRSRNIVIKNNIIMNIPSWEGMDTHSGENIKFLNNRLLGIRFPIVAGGMDYSVGTVSAAYPPRKIRIENNVINSKEDQLIYKSTDSNSERGIVATGTIATTLDNKDLGFLEELKIINNDVFNVQAEVETRGGISLHVTNDAEVTRNQVCGTSGNGIVMLSSNKKIKMTNNEIKNMSTVLANTASIGIRGSHNNGNTSNIYNIEKLTSVGTKLEHNNLEISGKVIGYGEESASVSNLLNSDGPIIKINSQKNKISNEAVWKYLETVDVLLPDERSYYWMESGKELVKNEE